MTALTPKQRMLNAYRGLPSDRPAVAPSFVNYYPAKVLGLDMLEFRKVPQHRALKISFEKFGCDGSGEVGPRVPNDQVEWRSTERQLDDGELETRRVGHTSEGDLVWVTRASRREPTWVVERPIKDMERDLPAFVASSFPDLSRMDCAGMLRAREEVGESYLLEATVGAPFFAWYAGSREGGVEQAIFDLHDHEARFLALRERYLDYMARKTALICERTPFESIIVGCGFSCSSLMGPALWRRWDRPVVHAITDVAHDHGRLVHVHFHGLCMENVRDFVEMGVDCVCPFERPPGGDVAGLEGLKSVARLLDNRVTMNGNVHTVDTLIRGTPEDVRREVREIRTAFAGSHRFIIGTGDQVGGETPEENLRAMVAAACEPV